MNTINEFKKYMDGWKEQEKYIFMLNYIREKEGEKLDQLLKEIMRKVDDETESNLLVPNGLNALLSRNFLDSVVSYYRYMKAKKMLEESKNE